MKHGSRAGFPRQIDTLDWHFGFALERSAQHSVFPQASSLFSEIRTHLASDAATDFTTKLTLPFDAEVGGRVYLTLFQPGQKPLRWGTPYDDLQSTMRRILHRIRLSPGFSSFEVADERRTRLLLEYVTWHTTVASFASLTDEGLGPYRFEPGVTGLSFRFKDVEYFYMPTEAFTRSHMTITQVARYLAQRLGIKTKNASIALQHLKEASAVRLLKSRAIISYQQKAIELYRGYPTPIDSSRGTIEHALFSSIEWLLRYQAPSGKFRYYYDATTDSTADFQHPKNPDYYNMLRHAGGMIALLRAYELRPDRRYIAAVERSIDYLLEQSRTYLRCGETARYVLDNKKAKLGGTGIGLVALVHYYRLTGDGGYLPQCGELVRHLLSQVAEDGEFIGYYIHPLFNGGRPIEEASEEDKRKLFSFYYPGEALLGLALYERYAPIDEEQKARIREAGRKALNFLVRDRPQKYPDLFLSLPADSWLMQAIEEWWNHPEMRVPDYAAFVFRDANQMIDHLYHPHNSPYPDYVGHFYYHHGQHALPDASRAEGLIAAYFLARMDGRQEYSERFLRYCRVIGKALMQTYNSQEALYAAKDPEKAVGAFRFKLTRQWIRVDSVQHAACFYARLLGT
ncbi:MAG TPA: hypothetical protein VH933_10215 [Aestuariivirgaceae bacterium]|jgi:hypothetical protein